jgi:hypothetical protein
MAISYHWVAERLDCLPSYNNKDNVVFTVFWRVDATDGQHTTSAFGSQAIPYDNLDQFTPYESLTNDQVVDWVKGVMQFQRFQDVEDSLARGIENLINPPVVTPPLPWA